MHKNSHLKMEWFKDTYLDLSKKLRVLDVGSMDASGDYNYSSIFRQKNWSYKGLDFEQGPNVGILVKDIYNWTEVKSNSFDVVVSGQFFEHLEFFWKVLAEIKRVLKPGGYLCIIVPSAGPDHGNLPNCYLFKESGLKAMAKEAGLEVLHVSVDNREEAKPWCDACLVAHKPKVIPKDDHDGLLIKMDNLEKEMNSFLREFENE